MKESNKNTMVLIIITIAVFLVAVLGATYAYFVSEKNVGSVINANVGTAASMYSFSASSDDRIEMDIGFNQMSQANISTEKIASDNAILNVSLASPMDDVLTTCTYDIVWIWDEGEIYDTPDGGSLPIEKDGATYNYEFSTMIDGKDETDLSKASKKDGNKLVLKQGASIRSTSINPAVKAYDISANVYNLPIDQTKLFGKSFNAHITVENLNCKIYDAVNTKDLAAYITQDVYTADGDNGLYYHDGEGSYTNANLEAGDNSYRYAGADPNNYICFKEGCTDSEKFRIIGVANNKVKVIKYKHAGYKKWNDKAGYAATEDDVDLGLKAGTTYTNLWTMPNGYTSSLNDYLNSEYLSNLGSTSDLIDVTTWHTGGLSGSERSSSNAQATFNIETNSNPTVDSKIALMYISDYMYAAAPNYWHLTGYNSKDATKDYRESIGNDWIYLSDLPMTISRLTDQAFYNKIWIISSDGHVETAPATGSNVIHPTFSLIPNAKIVNIKDPDVGSKNNPMIIK